MKTSKRSKLIFEVLFNFGTFYGTSALETHPDRSFTEVYDAMLEGAEAFADKHRRTNWQETGDFWERVDEAGGEILLDLASDKLVVLEKQEETNLFPDAVTPEWDGDIEVSPVCRVGNMAVEVCEKKDADFYSVYLHQKTGGVLCIADLPTEEQANQFAETLKRIHQNKQNSTQPVKVETVESLFDIDSEQDIEVIRVDSLTEEQKELLGIKK